MVVFIARVDDAGHRFTVQEIPRESRVLTSEKRVNYWADSAIRSDCSGMFSRSDGAVR